MENQIETIEKLSINTLTTKKASTIYQIQKRF